MVTFSGRRLCIGLACLLFSASTSASTQPIAEFDFGASWLADPAFYPVVLTVPFRLKVGAENGRWSWMASGLVGPAFAIITQPKNICGTSSMSCQSFDYQMAISGEFVLSTIHQYRPWIGLEFGYDFFVQNESGSAFGASFRDHSQYFGYLVGLSAGVDYALGFQTLTLGYFAELSGGQYLRFDEQTNIGNSLTFSSPQSLNDWHGWLTLGLRARY